jgi:4-diphosphocytidyl-2-C-methyl-D-erythritol kinase
MEASAKEHNLQVWQCKLDGGVMPVHVELAPAKMNLGLKVLGRRPDGYHEILSLMQTVDLADRVTLEPTEASGKTVVACDAEGVPEGPENLAYMAVEAVRAETGIDTGVRVVLEKRIPAGGGLGGGSSDAAAVLRGLPHVWPVELGRERMHDVAASLGSDVPFLLRGGTAIARGRGEVLEEAFWPGHYHFVLVDPGFRVSTAWAFSQVRIGLTAISEYAKLLNSRVEADTDWPDRLLEHLENDFLPLVAAEYPQADDILSALRASGAVCGSLSGTGATLYGVFRTKVASAAAAAAIRKMGYRCFICRAVSGSSDPDV